MLALVACGTSGEAQPQRQPPPAPAPAAAAPRFLDEAARLAKSTDDLIALARAHLARGETAAAGADLKRIPREDGPAQKLADLDVRSLLGEDETTALQAFSLRDERPEAVADAFATVESKPARAVVAAAIVRSDDFARIVGHFKETGALVPATAGWDALVAACAEDPEKLRVLAEAARQLGAGDVAAKLIHAAAGQGTGMELASELALQHDPKLAREVADRPVAKPATQLEVVGQAFAASGLEALLGNRAASQALEPTTQAILAIDDRIRTIGLLDAAHAALAVLAVERGDQPVAAERFRALSSAQSAGIAAAGLADNGFRAAAIALLLEIPAKYRAAAATGIIEVDVWRGDLAKAAALAAEYKTAFETVALGYARAGDGDGVASTLALDRSPTASITRLVVRMQLAWSLARHGKCDRARPLASELANAITYAIVARFCPP